MVFYIKVFGCSQCFIGSIRGLCRQTSYSFVPNNKKFYKVDTELRSCIGVDSIPNTCELVLESTPFKKIKNKFVKG